MPDERTADESDAVEGAPDQHLSNDPALPDGPQTSGEGLQALQPSILEEVRGAEKQFLARGREHAEDVQSAVRVFLEYLRGFEFMAVDRPVVTVFGSARFGEDHPYYQLARALGQSLAKAGFAVMTGAGPGIMEAANRGAREGGGMSLGANIHLPREQTPNDYLDRYVEFEHFFVRKVMLVKYSCAFVVMPGGFGTMDEIFETLTLMQTGKIEAFPVVCMGSDYWREFRDFMEASLIAEKTIERRDLELLYFTDEPEDAARYICEHPRGCGQEPGISRR